MKTVIATNNPGKLVEFHEIFARAGLNCVSMREAGIHADPEEDGRSFEENALIKARACRAELSESCLCMADDSGIQCDALGGVPGIYSARYGGPGLTDFERLMYLVDKMKNVPDGERGVQYYCAIACILPDGQEFTVNGICRGEMLREPRGTGGFGHDPVFYVPEYGLTFGELSHEIKNRISHRAAALRACFYKLKELNIC